MKIGKSRKCQEYFIQIPEFSRSFQGLENLKIEFQEFPGAVRILLEKHVGIPELTFNPVTVSCEGVYSSDSALF
jgi:hypothetical protein